MPSRRHSSATDTSPRTPSITMRILSSVGNRRRVARLVLRIRARAVSAERVAPVISVERVSAFVSSGMFTLPARSWAAGVDCPLQHPSQPKAGWLGPRCRRQSIPVFG